MTKLMRREGVPSSPDLERIIALPRRDWENDLYADKFTVEQVAQFLTEQFRTPNGSMTLRPVQAKALQEVFDIKGLFAPIPVGNGKTLITYLAPTVLQAKRPMLVVPAKLAGKTYLEFTGLMQHFVPPMNLEVVSYEKLSRETATALLKRVRPDLLMFDEAHKLKNRDAAVTRRIKQYIEALDPIVMAMSGTLIKRSLKDLAHILDWCLPADLVPLPHDDRQLQLWADALDEIKDSERRPRAELGELHQLDPKFEVRCKENPEMSRRENAVVALRERFHATPGIIAASCPLEIEASLNINLQLVDGYNDETMDLADQINQGVMPNGDMVLEQDLSARWRIMRTLTSDFWYDWEEEPPDGWLECRRSWQGVVRKYLEKHIAGMESSLLVAKAARAGKLLPGECNAYRAWKVAEANFDPQRVPRWTGETMLERIAKWTSKNRGIIWVSEVALGNRLYEKLGLPYFRDSGCDHKGRFIESVTRKQERCIVASVDSNSEGRNLQYQWDNNVIISPPPTGTIVEQLAGRTHRPGQESDEVNIDVFIGCDVEWKCFDQAQRDCRHESLLEGEKKLNAASISRFERPFGRDPLWGMQ